MLHVVCCVSHLVVLFSVVESKGNGTGVVSRERYSGDATVTVLYVVQCHIALSADTRCAVNHKSVSSFVCMTLNPLKTAVVYIRDLCGKIDLFPVSPRNYEYIA